MGEMDGKVVVITGAGSGMGRSCTQLFAQEGAKVIAADISGKEKETAAPLGWRCSWPRNAPRTSPARPSRSAADGAWCSTRSDRRLNRPPGPSGGVHPAAGRVPPGNPSGTERGNRLSTR